MPANVTPAYKAAEAAYRRARDPEERLECLREMHRTIPKHKGTEHIRADIKTRIKELTEQLAGPSSEYGRQRQHDPALAPLRFEHIRAPRRAMALTPERSCPNTQARCSGEVEL